MIKKLILLFVALMAFTSASSNASTIDWTIYDAVFDDGGTLGGSFSTDSTTGYLLSYDLTTTAGSTLGGYNYIASNSSILGYGIWGVTALQLLPLALGPI